MTTPQVTQRLAAYLVGSRAEAIPAPVTREAVRTFFNWLGCALGGARHETVDVAISALKEFSGPPRASVLGRAERFDMPNAALLNGISSHVLDFDDTHLKTIIHPAGPVASCILALAETRPVSGREFLHALVLGIETSAGSAMRSIRTTMMSAGTSPAPRACSGRLPPPARSSG